MSYIKPFKNWLFEAEEKAKSQAVYAKVSSKDAKKVKDMLSMPYEKFVSILKDNAKDPKVNAVLNLGASDGVPGDEKVKVIETDIAADKLFPTQSQIGLDNSLGYLRDKNPKGAEKIIGGDTSTFKENRILTANGKYILDGHHRWSQVYLFNPEAKIPALDLTLPGLDEKTILKVIQAAIAATYNEVNQTPADAPTDIFSDKKMPVKSLPEKMKKIAGPEVIEIAKKAWNLKSDEETIQKLVDNALGIKGKKPKDAPSRDFMPQPTSSALDAGRSKEKASDYKGMPGEFIDKIKSGDLNFKAPLKKK